MQWYQTASLEVMLIASILRLAYLTADRCARTVRMLIGALVNLQNKGKTVLRYTLILNRRSVTRR